MKKILLIWIAVISGALCFAQPANDLCASAIALTIQESGACVFATYTNLDATHEAPRPICDPQDIASVWFQITTKASENELIIKINNIETSWLVMDIFSDCAGTYATGLSANCFTQSTNINASITGFSPSTTYYVRVGNLPIYGDFQGTFEICVVNNSTVGIIENRINNELQVAPNPAKDVVSISIDGASSFNMEIYDLTGRMVLAETVLANSKTFDVSTFEKGMYMVKASTDTYTLTQRLIINSL